MTESPWLAAFRKWFEEQSSRAVAVCFPTYRPDLVIALADHLGVRHLDFRKEFLAPRGWQAAALPLTALDQAIAEAVAAGKPVVLQNVESLLAVHDAAVRRATLSRLLLADWNGRVILPLVLYGADLPRQGAAVYSFAPADLPEETLLHRLAGLQ
jgi:hypothetical protein